MSQLLYALRRWLTFRKRDGWWRGYYWAKDNYYVDYRGWKNISGKKNLGGWLASIGKDGNHAAEGVRYFLSK